MRLHPRIPGTVALWQLQIDFADTSGNALDLTSVDVLTNAPAAAPPFVNLSDKTHGVVVNDGCLMGVNMDASASKLMAPLTPLLRFSGACTFEWIMVQRFTTTHAYFACANPAGRVGGAAPDRIGSLYTLWSSSGNPKVSDKFIGSNLPSPGYGDFGYLNAGWAGVSTPAIGDYHPHHMAAVRDGSGNWKAYIDGVSTGPGVLSAGTNVVTGNEQFFVGAIETEANTAAGLMASMRVLDYARDAADILTDATSCLAGCSAALLYRGVTIRLEDHR